MARSTGSRASAPAPICSRSSSPASSRTFKQNPNYFKSDKGWFDAVERLAIIDVTARTNALNTGEIHYMDRCDLKTLDMLKQNPNVVIFEDHRATATTSM